MQSTALVGVSYVSVGRMEYICTELSGGAMALAMVPADLGGPASSFASHVFSSVHIAGTIRGPVRMQSDRHAPLKSPSEWIQVETSVERHHTAQWCK